MNFLETGIKVSRGMPLAKGADQRCMPAGGLQERRKTFAIKSVLKLPIWAFRHYLGRRPTVSHHRSLKSKSPRIKRGARRQTRRIRNIYLFQTNSLPSQPIDMR